MKRSRIRMYLLATLAILFVLLAIYRYEAVFIWQRLRVSDLPGNNKLWVHRVNSVSRFNYMKTYFNGLEADVVFDASIKNFRVYHPPKAPAALTLDTYLKALKPYNKQLWIDVKQLDSADFDTALRFFQHCNELYDIAERIIIESSEPTFINLLARHGFITSYLVPARYLEQDVPTAVIDSIKQELVAAVTYVSQADRFIPVLKQRFNERKIITWASFKNFQNLRHLRALMADSAVCIILIDFKSKGYL